MIGLRRKRRPGNRAMSVAERARMDRVKRAGCLCCRQMGFAPDEEGEPVAVEGHHLKRGNVRRGHDATVGLCPWHHRGQPYITDAAGKLRHHEWHREHLGPSLAEGAVPFHALFGTDDELLDRQEQLLARIAA